MGKIKKNKPQSAFAKKNKVLSLKVMKTMSSNYIQCTNFSKTNYAYDYEWG